MKKYTFSTITFAQIASIIDIERQLNYAKFDKWFGFDYSLNKEEIHFLKNLIKKNQLRIDVYQEENLKAKFLIPLLNKVDFNIDDKITDWYDYSISGKINEYELSGNVDFLVAPGYETPHHPYFFIQEFKPSFPNRSPLNQLLAELLVALHINQVQKMKGAFIAGPRWNFMILEKLPDEKFVFYVSKNFDAMKISDLQEIYTYLQAVKADLFS